MGFRFRIGPFTFGRTGTRLSLWGSGIGISTPLSGNGRSFGKVRIGPVSWFGQLGLGRASKPAVGEAAPEAIDATLEELAAIEGFREDRQFLGRLRQGGIPWRGVQERLKQELPQQLGDVDRIAYRLVPKAMNAVFGQQGDAWSTEKRPSRGGSGYTTWIVVK